MHPIDFVGSVVDRESKDFEAIRERIRNREIRLLHAGLGLSTEAGEFNDALKKWLYYGKECDKVNLIEELGDVLWYVALASDQLDMSIEEIMERNNAKLEARYGKNFSESGALDRDLDREYKILEDE